MDKAGTTAREHIAGMADLIGAVRLPEGSMRATAGTEVVIDVLVFQRRAEGQATGGADWHDLVEVAVEDSAAAESDENDEEDDRAGEGTRSRTMPRPGISGAAS